MIFGGLKIDMYMNKMLAISIASFDRIGAANGYLDRYSVITRMPTYFSSFSGKPNTKSIATRSNKWRTTRGRAG
jgi:hypothetical protein